MEKTVSRIAIYLHAVDQYLSENTREATDSRLETFVMACWRCFFENTQWLLLFYNNEILVPYWQIAFTLRLLMETVSDLDFVLENREKADIALREYENSGMLSDYDFIVEQNEKHKSGALLNCDIGNGDRDKKIGNRARIKKALGPGYASLYSVLCNFSHCNYCGIMVACSENTMVLRNNAICINLELCIKIVDVLSKYDAFNELENRIKDVCSCMDNKPGGSNGEK